MWLEVHRAGHVRRIVNLYLVPSTSTRFHHNDEVLEELEQKLAEWPSKGLVVAGDWNGRVGESPCVVITQEDERRGGYVDFVEKVFGRTSADKTVNINGQGKRVHATLNSNRAAERARRGNGVYTERQCWMHIYGRW